MKSKRKIKIFFIKILFSYSWILNFFHSADKNQSNTLTKKECRDLLVDSFHVEIPDHIFEQMFNVKVCCIFIFILINFYYRQLIKRMKVF
jgi:hypothetical protein